MAGGLWNAPLVGLVVIATVDAWLLVLWFNYGVTIPMGRYPTETACAVEAEALEDELYHEVLRDQGAARFRYEDWTVVCCRTETDECP